MPTILSTKKLTLPQKSLILNSGVGYVEYNAIQVDLIDFPIPKKITPALIFTSKNAVKAVLQKLHNSQLDEAQIFCVGEKTAELLEASGLKVSLCRNYGAELAEAIVSRYKDLEFTYFCGNIHREELPHILKENRIHLNMVEVYSTTYNVKKQSGEYDGVMFYSPSGVESYFKMNKLGKAVAFCIGNTTASEAKKYTDKLVLAKKPSIENLIVQVVKYYKSYPAVSLPEEKK